MKALLFVGIGGGAGSILRYLVSVFFTRLLPGYFPWGTFVVNAAGCLLIGFLLGLFEKEKLATAELRFLLVTGFCGGFTTFSTFASENISLFQSGNTAVALLYIGSSVLVSLLAVWGGMMLTR